MFTDKLRTVKMFGVAAIALLMMCSGVFILAGGENDAETVEIGGTEYTYAEVSVAPDYKWQYTVEFPSDLDADTKLSVETTKTSDFIANQLTSLGTADRLISLDFAGASAGETYILVLKAYHAPSNQTTYQAIKFTVVDGISIAPTTGALGTNFVVGDTENTTNAYTYTITTAIGKIVEDSISIMIDGDDAIFTPTKVSDTEYTVKVTAGTATAGKKTVVVTAANDLGEDATSTTTYIVYDELIAEDIIVRGYEKTSWDLVPQQIGTADATFDVIATAVLYDEMSGISASNYTTTIGENQLTRTKAPDICIDRVFVLTLKTTGVTPEQTKTAFIHIYDEPDFTLSPKNTEITTYNRMDAKTITFSASTDTLTKSWDITPSTGLALTGDGEIRSVTVDKDTPIGTYTVKVTTPSGQSETATIVIDHEDDFTISGSTTLNPVVTGSASNVEVRTFNYAISPEDFDSDVTWSIKSNSEAGVDANIVDGVLSLKSASPVKNVKIVLHAETACGNYADLEVTVNFYNVLSFNAPPTTGAYAYATNADNE